MEGFPHVQGVSSLSPEGPCFMLLCSLEREREEKGDLQQRAPRRGLAVVETRVSTAPLAPLRAVTLAASAHPQNTAGREAGKAWKLLCQACEFESFCGNDQGNGGEVQRTQPGQAVRRPGFWSLLGH